ncbi:RagB/SusD family nutrient uptake outer membrane protein, partial [Bacteroides heparinolyticus]
GCDFTKDDGTVIVFNTLDKEIEGKKNANYTLAANNASKTALTWAKYLDPITQYNATGVWDTEACPIVFRYAEVLLTLAEAENELNGPSAGVYDALDEVRARAGMPAVDKNKYATKEKLRELIRRERAVEFAGEGLRRADIVRWKTSDGKMVAEKVMNGKLNRVVGTVSMDTSVAPEMRATINVNASPELGLIEERTFKAHNRYLPIRLTILSKNPQLTQNDGY